MKSFKKTLGLLLFAALTMGTNVSAVNYYEYVVITKRDLIPAFSELLTWKNQKGLKAGAVAIEDILADSSFKDGDLVSGIKDEAGILRAYLQASKDKGVGRYVLLGGMDEIVPVRYGFFDYNEDLKEERKVPSDFYYSKLDANWDEDKDGIYGEEGDNLWGDIEKEPLYVGRLLCRTMADVKTWTRKQLIYEQNPGLGDPSYLQRVLLTKADHIAGQNTIKNYMPDDLLDGYKIIYEEDSNLKPISPTGADVINEINENKYGILINNNHGNTMQYAVSTAGDNGKDENNEPIPGDNLKYQVMAQDDYDEIVDPTTNKRVRPMTIQESGNGLDNLTNYNSPAIMVSTSCLNMPFDDIGEWYSKYHMRNLGEAFLCMNKGGGIAYFGNTRSSLKSAGTPFLSQFFEKLKECNRFGQLEYETKKGFYLQHFAPSGEEEQNENSYKILNHSVTLIHNLAGCPETYFWVRTPNKFEQKHAIIVSDEGQGTVRVKQKEVVDKGYPFVCVTGTNSDGSFYQETATIESSQTEITFTNVPSDYVVVVTCDGYLPYIYKSNECVIQNQIITGTEKSDCDYILAGAHVKMGKPEGDVIIKSGANVTFDAKYTTRIEGGFKVEKGGKLTVK